MCDQRKFMFYSSPHEILSQASIGNSIEKICQIFQHNQTFTKPNLTNLKILYRRCIGNWNSRYLPVAKLRELEFPQHTRNK